MRNKMEDKRKFYIIVTIIEEIYSKFSAIFAILIYWFLLFLIISKLYERSYEIVSFYRIDELS